MTFSKILQRGQERSKRKIVNQNSRKRIETKQLRGLDKDLAKSTQGKAKKMNQCNFPIICTKNIMRKSKKKRKHMITTMGQTDNFM